MSDGDMQHELLRGYERLAATLEALSASVQEIRSDAREARDMAHRINTVLEEQNLGDRFRELKDSTDHTFRRLSEEHRSELAALRQDVVAANTKIRDEVADARTKHEFDHKKLEDRLLLLEGDKKVRVGVRGVFEWLLKFGPPIITMAGAVMIAMGVIKK